MWKKRIRLTVIILAVMIVAIWCLDRLGVYTIPVFNHAMSADKIISPQEMKEDLDFIITTLKDVHPKTYKGFTEEQKQIIEAAYSKITKPLKVEEFYFITNEIVSSMQDAHTAIYLDGIKGAKVIDLSILWLKDGMYVDKDSDQLKKGDKIISIEGKGEADVLSELSKVIPAENPQWVKVMGRYFLTTEPYLRHIGFVTDDKVNVTVKRDHQELSVDLPLIKSGARANIESQDWVRFTIDKEISLGVFTLDQCNYNDKYKTTLNDFFKQVSENKIRNIAVDVRNNGGGNSMVVDEFIRYLDVEKYTSYTSDIRYSKQSQKQRHTSASGYDSYPATTETNKKIEDNSLIFKGNVYIITSPGTFSSANWFAVIFKDNKLGKIIGEPTGNQPSSYGDILSFKTPNTGFTFSVSYKKFIRPDTSKDPEDCLHPDIEIYTTIEDKLNGSDAQIEGLKEIIKNNK